MYCMSSYIDSSYMAAKYKLPIEYFLVGGNSFAARVVSHDACHICLHITHHWPLSESPSPFVGAIVSAQLISGAGTRCMMDVPSGSSFGRVGLYCVFA